MKSDDNSAKIWAIALTGSTLLMAAMFALAAYYLSEIKDAVVHPGLIAPPALAVAPSAATAVTGSTEIGTDTPVGVSLGTADIEKPLPAIEPPAIQPPPPADPSKNAITKDGPAAAPGLAVVPPKDPQPALPKAPPAPPSPTDKD